MCRLQTPQLEEALKGFPLYSQDGKGKEAICRAIFAIGSARWFILEGEREDGDTIMFGIAIGLLEDEYGYVSLKLNLTSYGFGILQVTQVPDFNPTALKDIKDYRLQELLTRLED